MELVPARWARDVRLLHLLAEVRVADRARLRIAQPARHEAVPRDDSGFDRLVPDYRNRDVVLAVRAFIAELARNLHVAERVTLGKADEQLDRNGSRTFAVCGGDSAAVVVDAECCALKLKIANGVGDGMEDGERGGFLHE